MLMEHSTRRILEEMAKDYGKTPSLLIRDLIKDHAVHWEIKKAAERRAKERVSAHTEMNRFTRVL